ncbi:MAG: hypothetical protein DMF68_19235, partial [Acidobacteria bacterium]
MQQYSLFKRKTVSAYFINGICPARDGRALTISYIFTTLEIPMQQKRPLRLFATIFFAFALALCASRFTFAQNGGQAAPQQRIPPRQYIPTRSYDTQHIKLDLHFDWEH